LLLQGGGKEENRKESSGQMKGSRTKRCCSKRSVSEKKVTPSHLKERRGRSAKRTGHVLALKKPQTWRKKWERAKWAQKKKEAQKNY